MDDRGGVYPIQEDPDHQGVGYSGPAAEAASGPTTPGLAEVTFWRSATRPASNFITPSAFIRAHAFRPREADTRRSTAAI
jgi:hypothetical protein